MIQTVILENDEEKRKIIEEYFKKYEWKYNIRFAYEANAGGQQKLDSWFKSVYRDDNAIMEIEENDDIYLLYEEDIICVCAYGHILEITTTIANNVLKVRKSLKSFEMMNMQSMVKINRAEMVNINYIQMIKHSSLTMRNGKVMEISRRRYNDVLNRIHNFATYKI